jgi:hypothetical protein
MIQVLILDEDPRFLISVQKVLPSDSEWLATGEVKKAGELMGNIKFDYIIVRKKNEGMLYDLIKENNKRAPENHRVHKKIIVLPKVGWRRELRHRLNTN